MKRAVPWWRWVLRVVFALAVSAQVWGFYVGDNRPVAYVGTVLGLGVAVVGHLLSPLMVRAGSAGGAR
ncbi:hypothetical protein ACFU3J_16285 [Streptomyces sp. NPDC057411]|uniref:hypothetical protein n=1 Tax=unclassified Streptomyces TaxID=2593676 RepID=UPI00363EA4BF